MTTWPREQAPGPVTVGPYRLLTRLGEGGMGVVHLGQAPDGSRVAVKVLRPHVVGDEEARQRLAREVGSLERVRSPRVAEIIDADPWGPVPYVATRYVPGLALHDHVREEGPLTGRDLAWFARGLGEALGAVHAVGVLHRDVKPSNVLMEGRSPVLIDFGLARVADDVQLTRTGWLLGTPGYLAPEILFGHEPTAAADVHSWAATVAFAATGRAPYGSGPSVAVMDRVRRGEHDLSGLDGPVRVLVERALDPDPARRPALSALLASLGSAEAAARPAVDPGPPTMPLAASPDLQPTTRERSDTRPETARTTAAPPPPTAVDPAADQAYDDHGDPADDEPTSTLPPSMAAAREPYRTPPPAEWPQRTPASERFRRGLLGVAGVGVVAALFGAAPWLTGLAVALLVLALRGLSVTVSASEDRRLRRGRSWYDAPLAVLASPWHLVVSLPGTLLLLLWTAGVGGCVAVLLVLTDLVPLTALWLLGAVLAVVLWTGPGASRVRSPVRRAAHPVAAQAGATLAALALAVVVSAFAAWSAAGQGTSWAPDDGPPWEQVGLLERLP